MKKKIDLRVRTLIENGIKLSHRTMYVLVGDRGRDQVVNLHYMLSKAAVKARPNVLWCYKKELGFTTHRKKRMQELKKKMQHGLVDADKTDPFDLFLSATDIRFCYYNETQKILGKTYGMCVLQDFEALTPNILARTIETVEGGGAIVILLRSVQSLQRMYDMAMDVHARYRTEAHQDVVCRFNERFMLSLKANKSCLILDDTLDVLPWAKQAIEIKKVSGDSDKVGDADKTQLKELQASLADTQPVGSLVQKALTVDQAKAILTFVEAISETTLRSTVALTAGRGRGKSAALGLSVAAAVSYGYSNIFVTSPSPENLTTLFEFVFKGFDALGYEEHKDYELVQSTNPDFNKAIVRVNVFRESHRQTIQYIQPQDAHKLGQAELVVIDEAAAIPLPLVKALMGPYLVFLASTIHGYEGTGRSLSIKLIGQLRQQNSAASAQAPGVGAAAGNRVLREIKLQTPIRYASGDPVEAWLESLLCLAAEPTNTATSVCPVPAKCELYEVNRDTLFSFNPMTETFLHRMMALYVASHYKNSPNDLQLLSDAPAHRIFCLLGPVDKTKAKKGENALPEILCVVQLALEGEISKKSAQAAFARGLKLAGDMIPWTIAQQYQDDQFPGLSGGRVVRIATHPDYQGMGYGKKTIQLLTDFYEGKMPSLSEAAPAVTKKKPSRIEALEARTDLPPLLTRVSEVAPERLDYLGVSFGVTRQLFKFWKTTGFVPMYVRQSKNELTGEHSTIMLKPLTNGEALPDWVDKFWVDFRGRFSSLLAMSFRSMETALAMNIVCAKKPAATASTPLVAADLVTHFTEYDLKRLNSYHNNLLDYHAVLDLVGNLAQLWITGRVAGVSLTPVQQLLIVGIGFQKKSIEELVVELGVQPNQLMALFSRCMRAFNKHLRSLQRDALESSVPQEKDVNMTALDETLASAQETAAAEFNNKFGGADLGHYAIDSEQSEALTKELQKRGATAITGISVKSSKKKFKRELETVQKEEEEANKKQKKKKSGKGSR
eukprot:m.118487 g.118487  ORF g.118487 m.118487 type:complete len:1007 (-) comp28670_c0_seq2:99-3119(-)